MTLMTWSLKRQFFYVITLILFIAVFAFLLVYSNFHKAPTCTDNRQNGTELGVDCGGSCAYACKWQVEDMSVRWARTFRVVPGRYNAVAYIVNHNKNAAVKKINYRFRFADANNVYIGKREGSTFVPPGGNFAVFEPGVDVGYSIPVYTTFEFTEAPKWLQVSQEKINQLKVLVSNIELMDETTSPRLSATVKNNSLFNIPDLGVIVVLYGSNGNALSASRTYLNELMPLQSTNVSFTWPESLPGAVVAKEIIPMFDVFAVNLQ